MRGEVHNFIVSKNDIIRVADDMKGVFAAVCSGAATKEMDIFEDPEFTMELEVFYVRELEGHGPELLCSQKDT